MKTVIVTIGMVLMSLGASGQLKGMESYIPSNDADELMESGYKHYSFEDSIYAFFFDHTDIAGDKYSKLTSTEIKAITTELERILAANGMDLEDYEAYSLNTYRHGVKRPTFDNILKAYKMGIPKGESCDFYYETGTHTIIFSMMDPTISLFIAPISFFTEEQTDDQTEYYIEE